MNKHRHYFHTFDALRFFAFFKVFLLHLPILAIPGFSYLKSGGGMGVTFFFVLSGFLITYIILSEKVETGTINFKHFILRRILRIWPLYYLMILFAYLTPQILEYLSITGTTDGYEPNLLVSLFFLENYKMIYENGFPSVSTLGVTWSICIEEHFYLVWGTILFFTNVRKVYIPIIISILIANVSRYFFYKNNWLAIDIFTTIDYFAYGAIPAYLLVNFKNKTLEIINQISIHFKRGAILIILIYILLAQNINALFKTFIEPTLLGLFFCSIIMIVLPENNRIKINQKNILSKLGTFTYGLYLLHSLILNILLKIFEILGFPLINFCVSSVFLLLSLVFTIVAGASSYYLIEKPFLNIKKHFQ